MKFMTLCLLFKLVISPAVFAADDQAEVLASTLKGLYVTHVPEPDEASDNLVRLHILLTFNSYQGLLDQGDVIISDQRYSIFVADTDFNVLRQFDFYFGGPSQFAVKVSGESELAVGKFGEYFKGTWFRAFAGLRVDAAFYDKEGYRNFIDSGCLPETGFRCTSGESVENFYADKNVAVLALDLAVNHLNQEEQTTVGTQFYVWGKAYQAN